jgi:hypothetical protein
VEPEVPPGSTWLSPEFDLTRFSGRGVFATMRVAYPDAHYFANTNVCQMIV